MQGQLTRAGRWLGRPKTFCYLAAPVATMVKAKKKCCKDGPRCKKCPVVLKKLEKAGYAQPAVQARLRARAQATEEGPQDGARALI